MEKAYDVKALVASLKPHGVDLAEEAAVVVVKEVAKWLKQSAELSETKFDDMAAPFIPMLEALCLEAADKIDGQKG